MNLPNSLSVTRIFLVPLLVVVLLTKFEGRMILGVRKELVGAAIFALASFTDWLDGYLARRRKQVTPLGQVIDPLADKLLTSGAFLSLVQMGLAPACRCGSVRKCPRASTVSAGRAGWACRASSGANPGRLERKAAATCSFSSGSLEQVA